MGLCPVGFSPSLYRNLYRRYYMTVLWCGFQVFFPPKYCISCSCECQQRGWLSHKKGHKIICKGCTLVLSDNANSLFQRLKTKYCTMLYFSWKTAWCKREISGSIFPGVRPLIWALGASSCWVLQKCSHLSLISQMKITHNAFCDVLWLNPSRERHLVWGSPWSKVFKVVPYSLTFLTHYKLCIRMY